MSAQPSPTPGTSCPLCGTPVGLDLDRCPDCGHSLAGTPGHAPAFSRTALLWTIGAFLAVYLITIGIVVATR
jgi:hypothetical protein